MADEGAEWTYILSMQKLLYVYTTNFVYLYMYT